MLNRLIHVTRCEVRWFSVDVNIQFEGENVLIKPGRYRMVLLPPDAEVDVDGFYEEPVVEVRRRVWFDWEQFKDDNRDVLDFMRFSLIPITIGSGLFSFGLGVMWLGRGRYVLGMAAVGWPVAAVVFYLLKKYLRFDVDSD